MSEADLTEGLNLVRDTLLAETGELRVMWFEPRFALHAAFPLDGLWAMRLRVDGVDNGSRLSVSVTPAGMASEVHPFYYRYPGTAPGIIQRDGCLLERTRHRWRWIASIPSEKAGPVLKAACEAEWKDFLRRLREQWRSCPDTWLEYVDRALERPDLPTWKDRWSVLPGRLPAPTNVRPALYAPEFPEAFVTALIGFGSEARRLLAPESEHRLAHLEGAARTARERITAARSRQKT